MDFVMTEMSDTIQALLGSAAEDVGCGTDELGDRLAVNSYFSGYELLPEEITEAWTELPLEAKAVAILFAKSLNEECQRRYDRSW